MQSDGFNLSRIATTLVSALGNVALKQADARLPRPCVVNVSQVVTVDKIELEERVGRLPAAALDSVLTGLRLLFDGD